MEAISISRKTTGIRILLTLLFTFIWGIVESILYIVILIQLILALITKAYNEPLRQFSNKVIAYLYKLIRFMTYNEKTRPFPFTDFPQELEKPEEKVE